MWMGKQAARQPGRSEEAALGTVTIGGAEPAVYTGSESREVAVIGPGCYWWAPAEEETALVLRAGEQAEQVCLTGRQAGEPPVELAPGEAVIGCGGSYIHLAADGTITIHGEIVLEGTMTMGQRG